MDTPTVGEPVRPKRSGAPFSKSAFCLAVFAIFLALGFKIGGGIAVDQQRLDIADNQDTARNGNLLPGFRTAPLRDDEIPGIYIRGGLLGMAAVAFLIVAFFGLPLLLVGALYDYLWDREKFNQEWRPPRPPAGRWSGAGGWDDSASSLDRLDPDPHREGHGDDSYGHHHHDWGDYGHHDDWGGHHGGDWDGGGFDGGHHGGPDY